MGPSNYYLFYATPRARRKFIIITFLKLPFVRNTPCRVSELLIVNSLNMQISTPMSSKYLSKSLMISLNPSFRREKRTWPCTGIDVRYSSINMWGLGVLNKVLMIKQTLQSLAFVEMYIFAISDISAWHFPWWLGGVYSTACIPYVCPVGHLDVNEINPYNQRRRLKAPIPCIAFLPITRSAYYWLRCRHYSWTLHLFSRSWNGEKSLGTWSPMHSSARKALRPSIFGDENWLAVETTLQSAAY